MSSIEDQATDIGSKTGAAIGRTAGVAGAAVSNVSKGFGAGVDAFGREFTEASGLAAAAEQGQWWIIAMFVGFVLLLIYFAFKKKSNPFNF